MDVFNVISGGCSILGLLISLFTLNKVIKIYNKSNDKSKTKSKINDNSLGDNCQIAGRDINGDN